MLTPTLDEVKTIAQGGDYRRIPVCRELYADSITPVAVMRILSSQHATACNPSRCGYHHSSYAM